VTVAVDIADQLDALRGVTSSRELEQRLDALVPQVRALQARADDQGSPTRTASAEAACTAMAAELVVLRKVEAAIVASLRAAGHLPPVGANGSAGVGPDVRADLLNVLGISA
jgi:hypothetical protein